MNEYGKTIRKIRKEKGYTMQQLSDGILSTSFFRSSNVETQIFL